MKVKDYLKALAQIRRELNALEERAKSGNVPEAELNASDLADITMSVWDAQIEIGAGIPDD